MKRFTNYLDGPYCVVAVDFDNPKWAAAAKIPTTPGWYFISTTAPIEALLRCYLWQRTYRKVRDGADVPVRNYCIADRAARFIPDQPTYWNLEWVYSGLAKSLRARAREHTFADPGTAALALAKYEGLHSYQWNFHYLEKHRFEIAGTIFDKVVLKLGEQIWRAKYGWPILCID